jgi:hypothetical protein
MPCSNRSTFGAHRTARLATLRSAQTARRFGCLDINRSGHAFPNELGQVGQLGGSRQHTTRTVRRSGEIDTYPQRFLAAFGQPLAHTAAADELSEGLM